MVFKNARVFPAPKGHERQCLAPNSTCGFQKLACEYFGQGAHQQDGLPYTLVPPFGCVGIGEGRALHVKLALSRVAPDLCQEVLKGQDPMHVLGSGEQIRHYTYGGGPLRGIRLAIENPAALNDDFNRSTPAATTVRELAPAIWRKIHGPDRPLRLVHGDPLEYECGVGYSIYARHTGSSGSGRTRRSTACSTK